MIRGRGTAAAVALVVAACAVPRGAPPRGTAAEPAAPAAPLSPQLIERIRRGPARTRIESASVVIPLRGSHELPLVGARIDGEGPFDLLIDLASNVTLVEGATARASGARLLVGRGGRGDIWEVGEVAIGGWVLEDLVIASYDQLHVAGVLGYNALDRMPFTIDYPRMQLRLGAAEGPLDAVRAIPFQLVRRMPAVPGSVGEVALELFLDTGASNWLSMPASMEETVALAAPAVPGPSLWNNQTGETRVRVARLRDDLRIGDVVIRSPLVFFDPDVEAPFLGSPLLAAFALRFDPERRLVELAADDPRPIRVPPYRTAGFTLERRGPALFVGDVIPGSSAEADGLALGARVLSVAGLGDAPSPADLRSLAASATRIRVTVDTAGAAKTLDIPVTVLGGELAVPEPEETQ